MITRETIYAALFSTLSAVAGFVTVSRRLKHWTDTPPAAQPALFVIQRREAVVTVPGLNPVYTLEVDAYLYAYSGDLTASPAQLLNPLLDAVTATLLPDAATNKQTLGGLVQHCWIEGNIETDEGVLGSQAVAIVPIRIKYA